MNTYKMDFEGYITAEFKFDIIKISKCHFRMHNCVVVSFRMNMIVIQTMTNPYRMPNIDTKGLCTTIIPLSSMKTYQFECNYEEVNVMVTKNLVARKVKSKCINVVATEPLGMVPCPTVEGTFDLCCERSRFAIINSFENRPFGMYLDRPYPIILINSLIDYSVSEEEVRYLRKVIAEGVIAILFENPKPLKTLYSPNYDIFIEKECIVMCDRSCTSHSKFCLGLTNNELEFRIPNRPLLYLFKFMGNAKLSLEIIKSDFSEFIMETRHYSTYAFMK